MLTLTLRELRAGDRESAVQLASETGVFRPAELDVLAEVLDEYLRSPEQGGYYALVAELAEWHLASAEAPTQEAGEELALPPVIRPQSSPRLASFSPTAAGTGAISPPSSNVALAGFVIFGPTPLTLHTWDVYWIVVGKSYQRQGVGRRLLEAAEARIAAQRGEVIRVETSSLSSYAPTRRFYEKHGYRLAGTIPHFYARGDDLCIYYKCLYG